MKKILAVMFALFAGSSFAYNFIVEVVPAKDPKSNEIYLKVHNLNNERIVINDFTLSHDKNYCVVMRDELIKPHGTVVTSVPIDQQSCFHLGNGYKLAEVLNENKEINSSEYNVKSMNVTVDYYMGYSKHNFTANNDYKVLFTKE